VARTLNRQGEAALILGRRAGLPARLDLSAVGDQAAQPLDILVIGLDVVDGEGINLATLVEAATTTAAAAAAEPARAITTGSTGSTGPTTGTVAIGARRTWATRAVSERRSIAEGRPIAKSGSIAPGRGGRAIALLLIH
jgi:hypothetical protein